jgi:heat shock protein HslJ
LRVPRSSPEVASLTFGTKNGLGGTAACSSFIGDRIKWFKGKRLGIGYLSIDHNKDMFWTTIACRDGTASAIGGQFWQKMEHAKRWAITGRTLSVTFDDGTSAVLEAAR